MKAVSATDAPPADVAVDRKVLLNETLRRRITGMELAPGAVLDEVGLAEEFGLSRPPVRECDNWRRKATSNWKRTVRRAWLP